MINLSKGLSLGVHQHLKMKWGAKIDSIGTVELSEEICQSCCRILCDAPNLVRSQH